MDVFSIISLLGGLALFLYGMEVMSNGLEKASGGKLNDSLRKATQNRFVAMLFGIVITVRLMILNESVITL